MLDVFARRCTNGVSLHPPITTATEQTANHIISQCPTHRALHGKSGLMVLNEETRCWHNTPIPSKSASDPGSLTTSGAQRIDPQPWVCSVCHAKDSPTLYKEELIKYSFTAYNTVEIGTGPYFYQLLLVLIKQIFCYTACAKLLNLSRTESNAVHYARTGIKPKSPSPVAVSITATSISGFVACIF